MATSCFDMCPATLPTVNQSCSICAEVRLQQDAFFSANASIVDEIAALGHALLHPPKELAAAAGRAKGCLPDHWTGSPGDYNLTRCTSASRQLLQQQTSQEHPGSGQPCRLNFYKEIEKWSTRPDAVVAPQQDSNRMRRGFGWRCDGDMGQLALPGLHHELGGPRAGGQRHQLPGAAV